jgi:hypothetical protein
VQDIKLHPEHKGDPIEFPGVLIQVRIECLQEYEPKIVILFLHS